MSQRPEAPCRNCGQMCRSAIRVCRYCQTARTYGPDHTGPVALTGGHWEPNGRGVMVWRADECA